MNASPIVAGPLVIGSRGVPESLGMRLAAAIPRTASPLGMIPASSDAAAVTSTPIAATAVTPSAVGRMIAAAIAATVISAPVPHIRGSALG